MQPQLTRDYLASQDLSETFSNRFWSRVHKTETCWLWTGKPDSVGYGLIGRNGRNTAIRSHRASWIINRGPIPKGMMVCHNCPIADNKLCVNPDHLYLGGNVENGRDRAIKHQAPSGELHYRHALTIEQVHEIRASSLTQTKLASIYGVGQSEISRIIHFKRLPTDTKARTSPNPIALESSN